MRRNELLPRSLRGATILTIGLSALTGCSAAAEYGQAPKAPVAEQQNAAAMEAGAQAQANATDLIDRYQAYLDATKRGDTDTASPLPSDAVIVERRIGDGGSIGTAVDAAMKNYAEESHANGEDIIWDSVQNGITNATSAHIKETLGITMPHPNDSVSVAIYDADGDPATEGSVAVPVDIKVG